MRLREAYLMVLEDGAEIRIGPCVAFDWGDGRWFVRSEKVGLESMFFATAEEALEYLYPDLTEEA